MIFGKVHFIRFYHVKDEILISCLQAKADTLDALEAYKGKCQPCLLFYAVSQEDIYSLFIFIICYIQTGLLVCSLKMG